MVHRKGVRAAFMKAERGTSVEVSSSAGSVVQANASGPSSSSSKKLRPRLGVPPTDALSLSLPAWSESRYIGSSG